MNSIESNATPVLSGDHVTVVMSTFNGATYIQQQLASLYAQTHRPLRILVRDDGSSDDTRRILEREQAAGRIDLLAGRDNMGPALSYLELVRQAAASTTAFIAFCDQDDVWLDDKLARAVSALSSGHDKSPAMYCSRLEIVGADLTPIGLTALPRKIGFGNALVESIAVGCSIVLNREAVDLVCRHLPAKVLVHDWWCYLVVSCFGEIVFDGEARIKYRQHGNNTFGVATGKLDRLRRNVRRFSGGEGRHWQSEQASAFLAAFGDRMPKAQRQNLVRFVEGRSLWWRRFQLAFSNQYWRQRIIDDLAWRMLVLINRY